MARFNLDFVLFVFALFSFFFFFLSFWPFKFGATPPMTSTPFDVSLWKTSIVCTNVLISNVEYKARWIEHESRKSWDQMITRSVAVLYISSSDILLLNSKQRVRIPRTSELFDRVHKLLRDDKNGKGRLELNNMYIRNFWRLKLRVRSYHIL